MRSRRGRVHPLVPALATVLALLAGGCGESIEGPGANEAPVLDDGMERGGGTLTESPSGSTEDRTFERLHYSDFSYLGAFKAPDRSAFSWAVGAIAHVPSRNTLVVVGKDAASNWFELSIPPPVISPTKNPNDLHEAVDLSGWMDVMAPLGTKLSPAKSIGGIAWYRNRFWVGSYEFYNVAARDNLGITSVDENFGDHRGAWRVGPSGVNTPIKNVFHANKTHNDVMAIPEAWSRRFTPGRGLAAGRHRGAGAFGGGRGPALYAFQADPWAPHGADLGGIPLMYFEQTGNIWPEYRNADGYHSIWVWSGNRQALIVASTKGLGSNYYGPGPPCSPDKGWHANPYEPRLYFIDVNDLGEVARGNLEPWAVRAYETAVPSYEVWRSPTDPGADPDCRLSFLRDFAFDAERGLLYGTQPKAYQVPELQENRMIIHVWQVN